MRVGSDTSELDVDTTSSESDPTFPSRPRAQKRRPDQQPAASSGPSSAFPELSASAPASPVPRDGNDVSVEKRNTSPAYISVVDTHPTPAATGSSAVTLPVADAAIATTLAIVTPTNAAATTGMDRNLVGAESLRWRPSDEQTNPASAAAMDQDLNADTSGLPRASEASTNPSTRKGRDLVTGSLRWRPAELRMKPVATDIDQPLNADNFGLQQASETSTNPPTTSDTDHDLDAEGLKRRTNETRRNPAATAEMDVDHDASNSHRRGAGAGRRSEDTSPPRRRTRSRIAPGASSASDGVGSAGIVAGTRRDKAQTPSSRRLRPRVSRGGVAATAGGAVVRRPETPQRTGGAGGAGGVGGSGSGGTAPAATPRRGAESVSRSWGRTTASRRPAHGAGVVAPENAGREGSARRAKRRASAEVRWQVGVLFLHECAVIIAAVCLNVLSWC